MRNIRKPITARINAGRKVESNAIPDVDAVIPTVWSASDVEDLLLPRADPIFGSLLGSF